MFPPGIDNTDQLAGYECARDHGRCRAADGKLRDRYPPEHLTGRRYLDWLDGYRRGLADRRGRRSTIASYQDPQTGEIVARRMGGSHRAIVERLAAAGVVGDVQIRTGTGPRHSYGI
jgi:hypothetical protein